jgi:transmembrane sensor
MDELQMREALGHVRPQWDDARAETALLGLQRKRRRRVVVRMTSVVTAALVAGAALLAVVTTSGETDPNPVSQTPPRAAVAESAAPSASGSFYLPDGSAVAPVDDFSRVVIEEVREDFVLVRVDEGSCEFEVRPRPERIFEVRAGEVGLVVLGTAFSVHLEGVRTRVRVSSGRVRVAWHGGGTELDAGEEGLFPPRPSGEPAPAEGEADKARRSAATSTAADWRRHARSGEFDKAALALADAGDVRDTVEDLLLAADAMRLSGHPARALTYLEQIAKRHRSDPRTPLAEFTRGRILLLQLGQPRNAAAAFRSTRRLAAAGPLAQDALAREVEAWYRAGELEQARELALEYSRRYPKGRRLNAVRRFGGLD